MLAFAETYWLGLIAVGLLAPVAIPVALLLPMALAGDSDQEIVAVASTMVLSFLFVVLQAASALSFLLGLLGLLLALMHAV